MKRILLLLVATPLLLTVFAGPARAEVPSWTPPVGYVGLVPSSHKCQVMGTDSAGRQAVHCSELYAYAYSNQVYVHPRNVMYCQTSGGTRLQCAGLKAHTFLATRHFGNGPNSAITCGNFYGYASCPAAPSDYVLLGQYYTVGDNECEELWSVAGQDAARIPGSNMETGALPNWSSAHIEVCTP